MNEKKLSVFLSFILRHKPEAIELSLDKEGYVEIDSLLNKMNSYGKKIDLKTLISIVENDSKERYSFDRNMSKIRANQGHSIKGLELNLIEVKEVDLLYHGTALKSLDSILEKGLLKRTREYVHLSDSINTAIAVGERHGDPIVIEIDVKQMIKDGLKIFKSVNGVFLVDSVPTKYLRLI